MGHAVSSGASPSTTLTHSQLGKVPINHEALIAHTEQSAQEPFWHAAFWTNSFSDPVAIFTLWLVIATTGMWAFTALMWSITRSSVNETRKVAKTAQDALDHERRSTE